MLDKGAHFHRCDFQVHTTRDSQWTGPRAVSSEERDAHAEQLVAACREKRLDAICISDHHDFAMVPHIRAAATRELASNGEPVAEADRLVVFPGLELTLGVPCQAILVLDADFPADRLASVLTALAIEAVDLSQASLPPVTVLDHVTELRVLHETLDQHEWMRGRYIVFPNVTDGGHKSLLRSGMQAKYKDMPCVGGYLDGSVAAIGTGNRRIIAGEDSNYGNKRIAVFQTSDSRSSTFTDLGVHSTWVKWARPTAEALRQACLASDTRVAHESPELPTSYVARISVSNSKFMGPIDLDLNRQYNAVIGGRGTGKSTLLHYLRWALCDQPTSIGDDELADPRARQQRLIEATLTPYDAIVEVLLSINGIDHIVRRSSKTGEAMLKVGGDSFRKVGEQDVRALLPILAYSQKQLSSVAIRLDELTRFVTAPIRNELAVADREIAEKASEVRQTFGSLLRYRQLRHAISEGELRQRSLAEQAAKLRSEIVAVSDDDKALLDAKPAYDGARSAVESWESQLERGVGVLGRLTEISRQLVELQPAPTEPTALAGDLGAFRADVAAALTTLDDDAAAMSGRLKSARDAMSHDATSRVRLLAVLDAYDTAYAEVKERSSAHAAQLGALADIESEARALGSRLEAQRVELAEMGNPQERQSAHRDELIDLYRSRSDLLAGQCEALSQQSAGLIRATLKRGQGLSAVADRIKGVVSGSGLRGNKVDAFLELLRAESDPLTTWNQALDELDRLATVGSDDAVTSEAFPLLARLGFAVGDIVRIRQKMSSDGWLDLALVPIADHPNFEYQVREDDFIPFSDASAGQQATALLGVLLSQGGSPLVIDQPEDDLDSQVVVEVVGKIWGAKSRRQLVFSSHNPNFVVNGDADLVVCCDYRSAGDQSGGRIKLEGAIDVPAVREEITRIMEGGERAFKLRKEKYGF